MPTSAPFVTVAKVGSIPEGQGVTVTLGGRLVAIFHDQGQYLATDDLCPHMGASLGEGCVVNGVVTCPWHAWRFNIRTGQWCDNPKFHLARFTTRIQNDEIQVQITPVDSGEDPS